jgi:dinuclear metal center YbgI/SA1388 family protein
MTGKNSTESLAKYFNALLDTEAFTSADSSMNGLQVDNDGAEITKIVFAVDASLESFKRCAAVGGNMLFVHHGLFWGAPIAVTNVFRQRIKFLLDNNIALYASHLPLDQHPRLGNNAALAEMLGIADQEPFGLYHGKKIGYKGKLKKPLTVDQAVKIIGEEPLGVYPFGKDVNNTCAVISGGAPREALQAINEGVDLYVTGEMGHTMYHLIMEGGLNLIAGGHYSTEVWGLKKVMAECSAQLNIEMEFIDIPTGL